MIKLNQKLFLVSVFVVGFFLGSLGLRERSLLVEGFSRCDRYPYEVERYEQSERYLCYVEQILIVTKNLGPKAAIDMVNMYRETDKSKTLSEVRCHNLGHHVGEIAARSGYSQETIIKQCGSSCVGGCLNGAAHHYLFRGDGMEELEKFCSIPKDDNDSKYTCFHGIGHALVEYTLVDLVATMEKCSLIQDSAGKEQCGHAAVMDYSISLSAPNSKLPSNAAEFCSQQDEIIKAPCYEFAGFIEYSRNIDIMSSFAICKQVPGDYETACQRRIAEAAGQKYDGRLNDLIDECAKGNEEEFYNCAMHTVQLSSNSVSQDKSFFPEQVCQRLPKNRYAECMNEVSAISMSFDLGFGL